MLRRNMILLIPLLASCLGPWGPEEPRPVEESDAGAFEPVASRDCNRCHAPDYAASQHPPHAANRFPTACEECHRSESTWSDTAYPNHGGHWPLTGRHATASCEACHDARGASGRTACVECHRDDHDRAHAKDGLSTDCAPCHTTSAWRPSTFDHEPRFPIKSGAHARYAGDCAACHRTPGSYRAFSCATECHPQAKMDAEHRGEAGYAYADAKCYGCHPQGRH